MDKEIISKLPIEEQCFIYDNHLEDEDYEAICQIGENFDYCVWKGWI